MNLSEFKAWFEGYTEAMEGRPTEKQWKRIQARVKEIKDAPTTYREFVVTYYPHYIPSYPSHYPIWYSGGGGYAGNLSGGNMQQAQNLAMRSSAKTSTGSVGGPHSTDTVKLNAFDAQAAFRDLGRADLLAGD